MRRMHEVQVELELKIVNKSLKGHPVRVCLFVYDKSIFEY